MRMIAAMEWEKQRPTVQDYQKVLLSKEGNFYRAYNESAWLLKQFMCTEELQRQRGDAKLLNASRYVNQKSDYVMAGFPLASLTKYLINYTHAETLEGGDIIAEIPSAFGADATVEQVRADYELWAQQVPLKEKTADEAAGKKKPHKAPAQQPTPLAQPDASVLARSGLFAILTQVISYPLENSTPQDNYQFISALKQQAIAML